MPVSATDIADLVATTLNEYGENRFTDLITDYRNTIALRRLINDKSEKPKRGTEIEFRIMYDHNNSARHVPLGYTAVVDIPNTMTYGKIPYRFTTWNWAIERRMISMNMSPKRIVNIALVERVAALASAAILFERTLWRAPAADDVVTPYGIPYYVVKSNTAATAANNNGFNGTVPAGHTTVANVSPTVLARWRNYATQYTTMTQDDLIPKLDRAMTMTNFIPIVKQVPEYNTGNDLEIYTNYNVEFPLKQLAKAQNENLGFDLDPADGRVMYRRAKIVSVAELDNDTTDPLYGINWGEMAVERLADEWMHETVFPSLPSQPTVSFTNTDCAWNLICRNRRRQFVLAKDTTMPA